jgi:phosphopantothenoylcysteine decarboxylase/phosphopantothenate--cysteine ligase
LDVDVNSLEALTRCDVLLIVPCTANMLAKIASGLPDDPVSLAVLSAPVPVAIAPAMHRQMWFSPATQRSVAKLVEYGHVIILPGPGKSLTWESDAGMVMPNPLSLALTLRALVRDG